MIDNLMINNKIKIFFQPIVSIKDKNIFAVEALTRAYDENDELISPLYLFQQAEKEKLSCKLDNYVRELALIKFQDYYKEDKDLLLFLNFEASIIDNDMSDNFKDVVSKYSIDPKNIIIEIKEDKIKDTELLERFVHKYRKIGFIIAIDDFGTGYSSFDRLALIRPDIVKVDRSIIYDIHNNFINSEILTAISNMCNKIGAMVLSEGVENKEEILSCMKKDIDIFQGFWFCRPQDTLDQLSRKNIFENIDNIGTEYKTRIRDHIKVKQSLLKNAQGLIQKILSILESCCVGCYQEIQDIICVDSKLEAIYLIDETSGIQIGKTVIQTEKRSLYNPSKDGHDHSLKEYYFIAKESVRGDYLSSKYISKASGNMCRTYSVKLVLNDFKYIICCDILN